MLENGVRSMPVLVVLISAVLSGCGSSFDHPLPWEASPLTDELVGQWKHVAGNAPGTVVKVSKQEDGALLVELAFPGGAQATFDTDKTKHRATVLADLLAADSLHVLQIRLDTYEEFDNNGEALSDSAKGYWFRRVKLSPETGLSLQRPGSVLGRVAEEELAGTEVQMDIGAAAGCVSDELEIGVIVQFFQDNLPEFNSKLSEGAKAEFVAALTDDETTIADFERQLAEFADHKVDPYEQLARVRSCIAASLPGDTLGHVFLTHADAVFSGDVDRYVRE